jgi:hypothetical protein
MPTFYVVLTWDKYKDPEYVLKTGYDIEAPTHNDAEQIARRKFAHAYGFDIKHITARTSQRPQLIVAEPGSNRAFFNLNS